MSNDFRLIDPRSLALVQVKTMLKTLKSRCQYQLTRPKKVKRKVQTGESMNLRGRRPRTFLFIIAPK